jgi:hypothetical protein
MKIIILLFFLTICFIAAESFAAAGPPSLAARSRTSLTGARHDTRLDASTTAKEPHTKSSTRKKMSKVEMVPLSILSFDGGGIKGAMSTRMLAFTLQVVMQQGDTNAYTQHLVAYIESFQGSYPFLWTVMAQQLDSLNISPQVIAKDGSKKSKWMDFSFEVDEERGMMESMIKVDLAYEYYLAHVLSISGTSTGGLISLATMLRMSLSQICALYMDPNTAAEIFPKTLNPLSAFGWLQAKYSQVGVRRVIDRIIKEVAPIPEGKKAPSDYKFVESVDEYNACLKARIKGYLHRNERNRMEDTLKAAKKDKEWIDEQFALFESCIKDASNHLTHPKMKRFRKLDAKVNVDSLEKLDLKEPSARYDGTFFSTRFLITSRCVNNAAAVVFDSHEPIESKDDPMLARGSLKFGDEILDVRDLTVTDVGLCTSAAPYFFKAHQVGKFYFHDGGVMANDPGLINLCISYGRFGERVLLMGKKSLFPVFKLFRVGCGKEEEYIKPPYKRFTPQGACIVSKLADIFMSADTHRTDLLATVLDMTYILDGIKLDATVPTGTEDHSLPMDNAKTLGYINSLFANEIDEDLKHTIVIPENKLVEKLSGSESELAKILLRSADFLKGAESKNSIELEHPDEAIMLMHGTHALKNVRS